MKIPTFLKWAGGKRKLLEQIDIHLPIEIKNYFEPFLGAGSVFFYIKQKYNPKKCTISDINKDLINTFIAVRDRPLELIKYVEKLKSENNKEFYLKVRYLFNQNKITGIKRCATFIYLNKTCFNGLYRVNKAGEFNVPYGKYNNPEIINKENILLASELLQGVNILCGDYNIIRSKVNENDFVYLDPCYDPLTKTSFANYTPDRFSEKDNDKLANFIYDLKNKGAKILFSNNVTNGVKRRYPQKEGFKWIFVECCRSINSISSKRGKIQELLIKTYNQN